MSSNMAAPRQTAPERARARYSAGRCVSTLARAFPLLTTKKLHLRSIIHELLWFLQGDTNIRYLQENGVRIWDEWADENGDLGPVYGHQWRHWKTPDGREIDQIAQLVDDLKNNPDSRRHLVTAWNPGDVERMALPPCHAFFQLYVAPPEAADPDSPPEAFLPALPAQRRHLSRRTLQHRFLRLLTLMLAQVCGYRPGDFVHTFGDAHLYSNHFEQARLQLTRETRALADDATEPAKYAICLASAFRTSRARRLRSASHIAAPVAV
jgi:thymidylate synthase